MDYHFDVISKSAKETEKIARSLATRIERSRNDKGMFESAPRIVCLYGELGVGKTVFAKGFAKGLGYSSRLLSPTFIIVRRYELQSFSFYHIDLYRIPKGDTQSLALLGLKDIFEDPCAIVFIEWAEVLGLLIPKTRLDIYISEEMDGSRHIVGKEFV